MTREDKLYSMKMNDLANLAERLGIKINKKEAKSKAIEKILEAENDAYIEEVMQQKKDLGIDCPKIDEVEICNDGTPYAEVGKEIVAQAMQKSESNSSMIDEEVFNKFVKKAQRLITQAIRDNNGYHITINVNNKDIFYHDKNLQNIRSAIGHVYRGEVAI